MLGRPPLSTAPPLTRGEAMSEDTTRLHALDARIPAWPGDETAQDAVRALLIATIRSGLATLIHFEAETARRHRRRPTRTAEPTQAFLELCAAVLVGLEPDHLARWMSLLCDGLTAADYAACCARYRALAWPREARRPTAPQMDLNAVYALLLDWATFRLEGQQQPAGT